VLGDEFGNVAVGIIQIAKDTDLRRAGGNTSRRSTLPNQLYAESAFFNYSFVVLYDPNFVRASLHAILASNACLRIDEHDALRRGIGGASGTNSLAWRIFTVIALYRDEFSPVRRKTPPVL
jgi:hypothetical protein